MAVLYRLIMILFLAIVLNLITTKSVLAFPSPEEMRANYDRCMSADESWHRRFGQYVVAFDLDTANKACANSLNPQRPRLAACHIEGGYIYAGYYCDDIYRDQ